MNQKNKIKEIMFLVLFLSGVVFGGSLLRLLHNDFFDKNINFVFYTVYLILAIVFFFPYLWKKIKSFECNKIYLIFLIGFLSFVAELIVAIVLAILQIKSVNAVGLEQAQNNSPFLMTITIIFIGPFVEEMAYRYCIFSFFPSHKIIASLISVPLFAFVHVWDAVILDGDYSQLIAMLLYATLGIGSCILYSITENIWYSIFMHNLLNAFITFIKFRRGSHAALCSLITTTESPQLWIGFVLVLIVAATMLYAKRTVKTHP